MQQEPLLFPSLKWKKRPPDGELAQQRSRVDKTETTNSENQKTKPRLNPRE
jgi:hypothetical protein